MNVYNECFNHGLSIITYHEIPLTSSRTETDFQRHMSLSILFLLVRDEKWFFVVLLLEELLTISF
jgi:hypothetical protein